MFKLSQKTWYASWSSMRFEPALLKTPPSRRGPASTPAAPRINQSRACGASDDSTVSSAAQCAGSVKVCGLASVGSRTSVTGPNLSVVANQPGSVEARNALSEGDFFSRLPLLVTLSLD